MATAATARARQVATEQQAVATVEREIRSTLRPSRSRYLHEYQQAFRRYESVISGEALRAAVLQSDVVLIGDYHSLESCQHFTTDAVSRLADDERPLVIGLEAFYTSDQAALDCWCAGSLSLDELSERVRFEQEWGYDWQPYASLLRAARERNAAVFGMDCRPRYDLRRVRARDRHVARRLSRIREQYREARLLLLVGESHLAPRHLPRLLREHLPGERVLNVLQNVDALYWQAAAEVGPEVEAVRVTDDVFCVFNATPLEKYDSYRRYLEQWDHPAEGADLP
jgi:hypothetical protein